MVAQTRETRDTRKIREIQLITFYGFPGFPGLAESGPKGPAQVWTGLLQTRKTKKAHGFDHLRDKSHAFLRCS